MTDLDPQDTPTEIQGEQASNQAEKPMVMTNDNADPINPDAVSDDSASSEESDTQVQKANDLSDDENSQQDGDYTVISPVQKPREVHELY